MCTHYNPLTHLAEFCGIKRAINDDTLPVVLSEKTFLAASI